MNLIKFIANTTVKIANSVVSRLIGKKVQINVKDVVVAAISLLGVGATANQNRFAPNKGQCTLEDEIYLTHHVVTNAQRLQEAEVVLYLDVHNNIYHHLYKVDAFNILRSRRSSAKDTILIESIEQTQSIACDSFITCIYPAHDGNEPMQKSTWITVKEKNKIKTENRVCGKELNQQTPKAPVFFAYRLDNRFHCRGWDTKTAQQNADKFYQKMTRYQKMVEISTSLNQNIQKYLESQPSLAGQANTKHFIEKFLSLSKQFFSHIKQYADLLPKSASTTITALGNSIQKTKQTNFLTEIKQQRNFINLLSEEADKVVNKAVDEMESDISKTGKFSLNTRNKSLIKALKNLPGKKGKTFVAVGRTHVLSLQEEAIVQETDNLPAPKKGTEQYELRSYLQHKSHALLVPKQKQLKWKKPRYRRVVT